MFVCFPTTPLAYLHDASPSRAARLNLFRWKFALPWQNSSAHRCVQAGNFRAPEGWRSPRRSAPFVCRAEFAPASWTAAALRRFTLGARLVPSRSTSAITNHLKFSSRYLSSGGSTSRRGKSNWRSTSEMKSSDLRALMRRRFWRAPVCGWRQSPILSAEWWACPPLQAATLQVRA